MLFGYFDLPGAPSGYWDVVVFNSDGQWAQLANAFNVIEAPSKGIFDKDRFFPQSGLKYSIDLLNKWFGGGGEEEQLAPEEEVYIPEEDVAEFEEDVTEFEEYAEDFEDAAPPSIFENTFNRWVVIWELTKEKTGLFINKLVSLF